jgi:hypothetical protein
VSHAHGPPPEEVIRARDANRVEGRDLTPAVGRRGAPGRWIHEAGAKVAGALPAWGDARWSFLYDKDTRYATGAANGSVKEAARRAREGDAIPVPVTGPFLNAPVWTWQVPVYFWFGGVATGSSFVALACDAAGDERAAMLARRITLGAILPGAPLLVMDLGRPLRFLNMLRIFKVRSPMSMGSWCLSLFSTTASGAVAADLLGRPGLARVLGAKTALLGTYLGSYTGVLLASTAVPVWARSRAFLPPLFMCTAVGGGAAVNRLALAAAGVPAGDPTRTALGVVEAGAMGVELVLSEVNERRLGRLAQSLSESRWFKAARYGTLAGLALRGARAHHAASALFLAAGLSFRFAWVTAGRENARDDEAVAQMARRARSAGAARARRPRRGRRRRAPSA